MKLRILALLLCIYLCISSFALAELKFEPESISLDKTGILVHDEKLNISYYVPKGFSEMDVTDTETERYASRIFLSEDYNVVYYIKLEKNPIINSYEKYIEEQYGVEEYQYLNINDRPCLVTQDTLDLNIYSVVDLVAKGYIFKVEAFDVDEKPKSAEENKDIIKQIYASAQPSLANINLKWADERHGMVFKDDKEDKEEPKEEIKDIVASTDVNAEKKDAFTFPKDVEIKDIKINYEKMYEGKWYKDEILGVEYYIPKDWQEWKLKKDQINNGITAEFSDNDETFTFNFTLYINPSINNYEDLYNLFLKNSFQDIEIININEYPTILCSNGENEYSLSTYLENTDTKEIDLVLGRIIFKENMELSQKQEVAKQLMAIFASMK